MHDYLVIASNESGVKICEIVHLMKEVGHLLRKRMNMDVMFIFIWE